MFSVYGIGLRLEDLGLIEFGTWGLVVTGCRAKRAGMVNQGLGFRGCRI